MIVRKDAACVVGTTDTTACGSAANQNKQLSLPGGGSLFVFGVQYAPTDNITITGGSGSDGFLGQIWAWTVQYTGGWISTSSVRRIRNRGSSGSQRRAHRGPPAITRNPWRRSRSVVIDYSRVDHNSRIAPTT